MESKLLKVTVLGIGGCGGNVLADIYKDIGQIEFHALNTDVQALNFINEKKQFPKEFTHQMGERSTKGLGAGSSPEVGKAAAEEDIDLIKSLVYEKDLVIVVTGVGGGSGSGITPIVLREAKEQGALTICWAVMPFPYEGFSRIAIAKKALKEISEVVDTFIILDNDAPESLTFKDGMNEINIGVSMGIQIILDVLTNASLINLDFNDFRTVLQNGARGYFSYASFDGNKREESVIKSLVKMNLQTKVQLKKVQRSIVFIRGGSDMRKDEIKNIVGAIQGKLADDCLVLLGVTVREDKDSLDAVFLGTTGDRENS